MRKINLITVSRFFTIAFIAIAIIPSAFAVGQKEQAEEVSPTEPIVLKLGNVQSPTLIVQEGLKYFAELVKERTNGAIEIQIFPASQLGTEHEILEGVLLGTIHMYEGSIGAVGRFLPEMEAFAGPFVWRDYDHMIKVGRGSIVRDLSQKLIESNGMRILDMSWDFGARNLTTRNTPVYRPSDLEGLKIRCLPTTICIETIKAMGANPTPLEWKEVYMGLQTGVVDGQENPIGVIHAAKFWEVQKYVMLTGHINQPQIVVINEKVFQNLSPKQRQIIEEAVFEAGDYQNGLISEKSGEYLQELKENGMIIIGPEEGLDIEAFREATRHVFDKFEQKWEPGFFERIQAVK